MEALRLPLLVLVAGVVALALRSVVQLLRHTALRKKGVPPMSASGWVPVLGHALSFRADPVGFFEAQRKRWGDAFAVDLSGTVITVVAGGPALEAYLKSREGQLSARAAIATFGFEQTLGKHAVWTGADLHRRLVLSSVGRASRMPDTVRALHAATARRLREAVGDTSGAPAELFGLVRKAVLAASVDWLVGDGVGAEFVPRFMRFQDDLEEATAQAIALPPSLAGFALRAVRRQRAAVERLLAGPIAEARARVARGEPERTYLDALVRNQDGSSFDEQAVREYVVGILFAAHKNVAIAVSNALCFLAAHDGLRAEAEAEALGADPGDAEALLLAGPLSSGVVHETLRLTAHTIGSMRRVAAPAGVSLPRGEGLEPLRLPEGAYVAASHSLRMRDPALFPGRAAEFDPRPCADLARGPDTAAAQRANTPFSAGAHACPGRGLALHQVKMTLWLWFRLVSARWEDLPPPPLDFTRATLAQRARPVRVRVSLRRP